MSPEVFPALKNYVGKDLITTDGTSLLGGDDKAGIAEIMTMAEYFMAHPEIPHGTIKIAFTPDEEVGTRRGFLRRTRAGAPMWLIQWTAEPSARWNMRPSTQLP